MKQTLILLLILFSAWSMVAAETSRPKSALEFGVAGMSCGHCASSATDALKKIPGVVKADVDFASKRGRIEASREISPEQVRSALGTLGFEALFEGDEVIKPLSDVERAKLDIKLASNGEAIDIRQHLAPGKVTIFDFWAEWCGPCHLLNAKLERLVQNNPGVALRKIDLKSWTSPAAKQATSEFKVPALPYVRIYGPDGKYLGLVVGNDIDQVKKIISGAIR